MAERRGGIVRQATKSKPQVRLPRRFGVVRSGEWVKPHSIYHMKCCDCGLIHRLEFRLQKNRLEFRAWRVAAPQMAKS